MTVESMKRHNEPKFDMDNFEETVMTNRGTDSHVMIRFEGYDYDHAFRIVKLKVELNGVPDCFFSYLQEQILELIGLRINKNNIVLETKIEYV